ncbi:MAG: glycosyltransferase family 2 protein, partial [Blastocatellia bacterium]
MQSDANRSRLVASIVIPTKNRAALLGRFLPSLAEQSITEPYEIIIVDNGSSDSTAEVAGKAAERWPHIRRIVEDRPGSAYACHAGAVAASAPLLIFIDDDMRAEIDLVGRHVAAHREAPNVCVLGNVLSASSRHPFERMMAYIFDGPRKTLAQRPPTPSDYWSGHVSMARDLYFRLGGYNKSFAEIGYGKDFDFGGRLIAAGIELRFIPEIITYHH